MVKKTLLLVSIGYTIALLIASLVNINQVPKLGSSFDDKIYHALAYLILSFLWMFYFKSSKKKYTPLTVFGCVVLFGFLIEVLQFLFNPNRTYDLNDIVANAIGAVLGTLIALKFNVYKLK